MPNTDHIKESLSVALPIMLGYVAIGLPCGILSASIGLDALQVFLLSLLFYSGAGQFMIPNMFLAGSPLVSIIASVSLINTRQMLYSASLAQFCQGVRKRLSFLFSATVTDESYGVNMAKFQAGDWSVGRACMVNLFSQTSWALSNVLGVLIGNAISVPLAIASFAMTAIFICLLCSQKVSSANVIAVAVAALGVFTCKSIGLSGPAILIGALAGVMAAMLFTWARQK
ncbi:MAG: AzlC family ABC transporter permease [Raoultibacter sp.]